MPFGVCNAPSTFQRLMKCMFGDQQCQSLLLYLDDIVVFSSNVLQHLDRLELILSHLEWEGLKAFFQPEVKYSQLLMQVVVLGPMSTICPITAP